jgi:hypothetical protein
MSGIHSDFERITVKTRPDAIALVQAARARGLSVYVVEQQDRTSRRWRAGSYVINIEVRRPGTRSRRRRHWCTCVDPDIQLGSPACHLYALHAPA